MFSIARTLIRNKVVVLAAAGLGAFFFMPEQEEEKKSTSPWALQEEAPATTQAKEAGFVDGMMTEAGDFLDENGINPTEFADEHVGRFEKTASAYGQSGK